jgi:hypothetical protein
MDRKMCVTLIMVGTLISFTARSAEHRSAPNRQRPVHGAASSHDNTQEGGQPQSSENKPNAADEHERVTLPADSVISVRIADEINSSHNHTGDLFTGIVDPSVLIHDRVVIPRGTEAHVRMAEAKKGGHVKGKAEVSLQLISLVMNGKRLEVETDVEEKDKGALAAKAKAEAKSGEHAGGGGTGVAGPAGAAAGPVIAAFSAAKIEMKPGTRVEFTLSSPFTFEKPAGAKPEQPQ